MSVTTEEFTVGLNTGQKEAFQLLKDFINVRDGHMFILRGYAGTGKTFLVKRLIQYINRKQPKSKIAVTAPTNKAVKVLSRVSNIKDYRITYQTIHKLLGLTEEITLDGKQKFTRKNFGGENEIEKYNYLIVDEVSMLDDELFFEIQRYSRMVKIIFMGDPAQIPPVNKADCIPFNDEKKVMYDFREFTLTEIMRQDMENPIVAASFQLRNNLDKLNPIPDIVTRIREDGTGLIRIDSNKAEDREKAMQLFNEYFNCEEFKKDADYAKVIAWRNVTVDNTNNIIRSMLFGKDKGKIVEGEKLIANKPIMEGELLLFNTSDEFVVEDVSVGSENIKVDTIIERLHFYDCRVKGIDIEGKEFLRNINILHEKSEQDFARILAGYKAIALKLKGAHKSWLKYYEFMRRYADVKYNYAITGHKSQGSTYKNVFIIEDDIDLNQNIIERNRIKYTSYSRPAEKLFILKR